MHNLDGLTMFVSSTATNGVVDDSTHLRFSQRGDRVFARYSGGRVGHASRVTRAIVQTRRPSIEARRLRRVEGAEGELRVHLLAVRAQRFLVRTGRIGVALG